MDFAGPTEYKVKKKNQRKRKQRQVLRPYQRTKKAKEHEGDNGTSV